MPDLPLQLGGESRSTGIWFHRCQSRGQRRAGGARPKHSGEKQGFLERQTPTHPLPKPGGAGLLVPSPGGRYSPGVTCVCPWSPEPTGSAPRSTLWCFQNSPKRQHGVGKSCHRCRPLWGVLMGKKRILSLCHGSIPGAQVVSPLRGKEPEVPSCGRRRKMPPAASPPSGWTLLHF